MHPEAAEDLAAASVALGDEKASLRILGLDLTAGGPAPPAPEAPPGMQTPSRIVPCRDSRGGSA